MGFFILVILISIAGTISTQEFLNYSYGNYGS